MPVSVELQGEDGIGSAIEAAVNRALGGFDGASVSVVASSSNSKLGGVRSQEKNTIIAKVLAKQLRDPFYLDAQGRESVRFALNGLTASAYSIRKRALDLAGEIMLNAIGRNIERQQNPGGKSFKDLTDKYAAAKQRKFGFKVPIGKAAGDLLGGLRVVIAGL